jgi:hypothetical protein
VVLGGGEEQVAISAISVFFVFFAVATKELYEHAPAFFWVFFFGKAEGRGESVWKQYRRTVSE